jgi:hypothetical protein
MSASTPKIDDCLGELRDEFHHRERGSLNLIVTAATVA